jgi:hypothetical protein
MAEAKDSSTTLSDSNWHQKLRALDAFASRLERRGTSAIVKMGSREFWRLFFPDPRIPGPRSGVAKTNRAVLKENIERLDEPLERLHGVLDDSGQSDLLAVMLICFNIGSIDDPHLKQRLVELEKARDLGAEPRKKGHELALKYATDTRKEHPKKFKSNLSMAKHITPLVMAEMEKLYPGYTIDADTVRKWLAKN